MRVFKVQLTLKDEIAKLKPGEGYICITGYDRARITLPLRDLKKRVPGFIPRITAPKQVERATPDSKDPAWRCYQAARDRCTNPNAVGWDDYGGKNPPVLFLWTSLKEMLSPVDEGGMGPRPAMNFTIGRRGDQGNYERWNCYWETREDQNRNRRGKKVPSAQPAS